jgi:probable addiction module antidote protein
MRLKNINETLSQELKDPEYAALYLKEALNENGIDGFLLALRNLVVATEGMAAIAREAELGRESLYKALSEQGNPQFSTICKVISALGLELSFQPTQSKPDSTQETLPSM